MISTWSPGLSVANITRAGDVKVVPNDIMTAHFFNFSFFHLLSPFLLFCLFLLTAYTDLHYKCFWLTSLISSYKHANQLYRLRKREKSFKNIRYTVWCSYNLWCTLRIIHARARARWNEHRPLHDQINRSYRDRHG